MLFPKNRMRLTHTRQGKNDPEGWITLDLAGFDLEGIRTLYLPVSDLNAIREGGDKQADRLNRAKTLLRVEDEDLPAEE